jgi:hypothetical protein
MDECFTLEQLKARWGHALAMTLRAVARRPNAYRELRRLAEDVVCAPLDIGEYMPVAKRLVELMETLDPQGTGSIFHLFAPRMSPSSIWHMKLLRVECQDMLAHLREFEEWRLSKHRLRIVK